jgi:hypothetical protein
MKEINFKLLANSKKIKLANKFKMSDMDDIIGLIGAFSSSNNED